MYLTHFMVRIFVIQEAWKSSEEVEVCYAEE